MNKFTIASVGAATMLAIPVIALAATLVLKAAPWEYDPGNTRTVVGKWVDNLGLQDDTGTGMSGLLLSKNTNTSTNSAAGASIKGVKNLNLTELGYDLRNGGHCGAGAPRFDVITNDNVDHFVGCTYMTSTPNGSGWTTKRMNSADLQNPAKVFPPIASGASVKTIDVVFDEGTDTGPDNSGLAILDNIDVNGVIMTKPGDAH